MNIGRILNEVVGGAVTIAVIGGIAYTGVALASIGIQDQFFYGFGGTVQVREIKLDYKGVKPYDSLIPWPWQDKDGHAEIELRGNERVFLIYNDLTLSSLEGRIIVKYSKGKEVEFDENAEYDEKTREDISKLEGALESVGSDKSIRDIVEQEIKEAIARK